jgi:predicted transglutaminase-like cysteine proteinase
MMTSHLTALLRVTRLGSMGLLCLLAMLPMTGHAASLSGAQVSSSDLSAFTKWAGVLARYDEQKETADADCKDDSCNSRQWEKMLAEAKGKPVQKQMQLVNDFFNKFTYINDPDNGGGEDYWATPYEFMARGGDCEDYAIAKYISLKRLGVDESHMRIMIVQDFNLNGEMHAILEVKDKEQAFILDNQAAQIIAEKKIYHYQPLYAINEQLWWAYM